MDHTLLYLQHLYGEREDPEERYRLRSDADLRAEWEAHKEVKSLLDERPRQRPSADVLAAVYAHASAASDAAQRTPSVDSLADEEESRKASTRFSGDRAPDRSARERAAAAPTRDKPSTLTMVWAGSLALMVGLLVGSLFLMDDSPLEGAGPEDASAMRGSTQETTEVPAGAEQTQTRSSATPQIYWGEEHPSPAMLTSEVPDDLPAWDDDSAFQDLRYHLRLLNSRSPEDTWFDATQYTARPLGPSAHPSTNRP